METTREVPLRSAYPPDWPVIARAVKDAAGWCCVRCGRPHDPRAGYTLTVHHLDRDPSNCVWWNLLALCQRCHLSVQSRVDVARPWVFHHSRWFQVYVAGYYAWKYLGILLTRDEVQLNLDALLTLEAWAVIGRDPIRL